jgi:hypothetical protein
MRNFPIATAFLADLDHDALDPETYETIAAVAAFGCTSTARDFADEQLFDFAREAA